MSQSDDDDEIALLLADLAAPDVQDRLAVLKVLAQDPTGDARVAAAIEPLLADRTPCLLTAPPSYGELCWLAAHALAAERAAGGHAQDVMLTDAVRPLTGEQLDTLARQALGEAAARLRPLQQFEALAGSGALKRQVLVLGAAGPLCGPSGAVVRRDGAG